MPKTVMPKLALMPSVITHVAAGAIALLPFMVPCVSVLSVKSAQAQSIVPAADGTRTIVTPNGNRLDISGGTRSQDGTNLFQSFQQFGLSPNQVANFLATPQTRNILGRVVGGDASVINGLIQVTGGTPNLYLMNPAGIVFGANASLNVPGAFTATTATGIGLNNRWFSAIGANDYANLSGDPNAFAFTVTQPGAIVNAGSLAVLAGQSLSLLGGTVVNTGTLTAPGGQITIAAMPGQTLVRLTQPGSLLSFELQPLNAQPSLGTSSLPNTWTLPIATLPALLTGGNLQQATGITVNPDGTIRLVTVPQQTIVIAPGTTIVSGTVNASGNSAGTVSAGGTVQVLGDRVGAIGSTIRVDGSAGGTVLLGGGERGQGTVPNASSTIVDSSSTITADGWLNGSGGRVTVWSDRATQFLGTIRARGGTLAGNGGFVEISSKGNLAYRGFVDATAIAGTQGTVLFDPENITIVAGTGGTGDGRLPALFSGDAAGTSLTISQNALENTSGDVILEATNDITIQPLTNGTLALGSKVISIIFRADADQNGVGSFVMGAGETILTNPGQGSGNLSISGANLTLGTLRTASTTGNAGIITLSASGNITATAIDATSFDASRGLGNAGGAVSLTAGGNVMVGSISTIGVQSAGDVTLIAQGNVMVGDITANVGGAPENLGAGGSIAMISNAGSITTGNLLTRGFSSSGNVTLTAPSSTGNITFASIDASTQQPGSTGGTVDLTAGRFVRGTGFTSIDSSATITTSGGTSGAITIEHGGGELNTPFVVGDATTNGTAGAIVTDSASGPNRIAPTQAFPGSVTQGKIQIITATSASPDAPLLPPDDPTDILTDTPIDEPPFERPEAQASNFDDPVAQEREQEQEATAEFENHLDLPDETASAPPNAPSVLSRIGQISGVKPALVYASFVPPNVATGTIDGRVAAKVATNIAATPPQTKALANSDQTAVTDRSETLWQFNAPQGTSIAGLENTRTKRLLSRGDRRTQSPNAPVTSDNDQLELIVVTADGTPTRRLVPGATRGRVLQVVHQLLSEISDPRKNRTTTYLAPAQQLYRWLVAPIEGVLQAKGISNLAYISDAGLRFLPLGALHDGRQFLVEKYSIGLMPSLSLTDTRYVSLKNAKVLAMGASEFTDQPPLPAVPTELSTITKDLWTGTAFLNQAFTLENLKTGRQQEPFQIVHLATHGEFQPGALGNSYIQLWKTKLKLNQLRQLGWNNPPVELLVLSACHTALGSDEAELGFAGFAVQAGVKSALASLWYVSDEGTLGLMTEFYRQLRTAPIKAEALRAAQIAMLRGEVQITGGQLRGSRGGGIQLPIALTNQAEIHKLSHPYYWAAFTLIGSPW